MTDNTINYRRFSELYTEFDELLTQLHAFYLDSVTGFLFIANHIQSEQVRAREFVKNSEMDSEAAQDTRTFTYDEIFSDGFGASTIHRGTQGDAKSRNAEGGANFVTLGRVCLVSFYDFWEDYLRQEIAIALGLLDPNERSRKVIDKCVAEHVRHDLWGDIGKLRKSIVHNRGIAISDVIKCKLIKWFNPGDPIAINPKHMRAIFIALLIYRNELHRKQFPPITFTLGDK